MAVVDHERAWLRLKEHVLSKRSHGQAELLGVMASLEVENELSEGERDFSPLPPAAQGDQDDDAPSRALAAAGA